MKTTPSSPLIRRSWLFSVLGLLASGLVIYVVLPHQFKSIRASTKLQTGQTMEATLLLQSPWGWWAPDRIADLHVNLNGYSLPVKREAYAGLGPIDTRRGLIIAETKGFPDLIVWGVTGQALQEVHWRFLNYYFSERQLVRNHQVEDTQYANPGSGTPAVAGPTFPAVNPAILSSSKPKLTPPDFHVQAIAISSDQIKKATKQEIKEWKK